LKKGATDPPDGGQGRSPLQTVGADIIRPLLSARYVFLILEIIEKFADVFTTRNILQL